MNARLLFCLLCCLLHKTGVSQFPDVAQFSYTLQQSERQWMVQEVYRPVSDLRCRQLQETFVSKLQDSLSLFNKKIALSSFERSQISEVLFNLNKCDRCIKILSLCDLYFPLIDKKLNAANLHKDYRYLPLLISGLNQSYKEGDRAGLWGINYLLAKKMHLVVDDKIDERNSGDVATDAAIRYLAELNATFEANDFLTTGAYLYGVPKAKANRAMILSSYSESRDTLLSQPFILLAALKILVEHARVDNSLQHYFDVFEGFESVRFRKDISFAALAAVLNTPLESIRSLNPTYIGEIIPADYKRVTFLLDKSSVAKMMVKEQELYSWQASPTLQEAKADSVPAYKVHYVLRGETLARIASKHKVKLADLRELNNLKNDRLQAGMALKIPSDIVAPKQLEPLSNPSQPKTKTTSNTVYIVKKGDSLWKIAQKYPGVTEQDIMKWNKIGNDIRPGQKLIIKSVK